MCKGELYLSTYDRMSNVSLACFFVEINNNIQKGILSKAMYHETNLIQLTAKKRNLSVQDLQNIYCNREKV